MMKKVLIIAVLSLTVIIPALAEETKTNQSTFLGLLGSWWGNVKLMPIGFTEELTLEIQPKDQAYEMVITSPRLKSRAKIPKLVVPLIHTPAPKDPTKGKISLIPPNTAIGKVTCDINYQETDGKTNGTFTIQVPKANIRVDGNFGLVKKGKGWEMDLKSPQFQVEGKLILEPNENGKAKKGKTKVAWSKVNWLEVIEKQVPPLTNPRGNRWPMILWDGVGFEPLSQKQHEMLLKRGLTQHIRMNKDHLPAAKNIQIAGAPVIMMEGRGGSWPYTLAPGTKHILDKSLEKKPYYNEYCLLQLDGWKILQKQIRDILLGFKEAGVTVDAMWMDWESGPRHVSARRGLFEGFRKCRRCQKQFPKKCLKDDDILKRFIWDLYYQLNATYMAGTAREIFPEIHTTNWNVVCSTEKNPACSWDDKIIPPVVPPSLFSATNPIAYGNDVYIAAAVFGEKPSLKKTVLNQNRIDELYTHLLLRQVSVDTENRQEFSPQMESIPWVARWCPDLGLDVLPMDRYVYREVLRHLWLRGIDGMQIFNPARKGHEQMAIDEVIDAVVVYNEMLAYKDFLDNGEVLNLKVPPPEGGKLFWSGLKLKDRAMVRVYNQAKEKKRLEIKIWPDQKTLIGALPQKGQTFMIEREKPE